jgi:hypothetical protein
VSLAGADAGACDKVYPDAPHIRNEMLGRHELTGNGLRHVPVVVEYSAAGLDLGFWRRHDRHPCLSRWLAVWVPETVSPMPPGQICGLSRQAPALPAPLAGDLRGCATPGTPRVQQPRCRVGSFLPSASRYISGTTSRDHESCPAFWPPLGATAVHFQLGGLDL